MRIPRPVKIAYRILCLLVSIYTKYLLFYSFVRITYRSMAFSGSIEDTFYNIYYAFFLLVACVSILTDPLLDSLAMRGIGTLKSIASALFVGVVHIMAPTLAAVNKRMIDMPEFSAIEAYAPLAVALILWSVYSAQLVMNYPYLIKYVKGDSYGD